jgi:Domain of unknown function (DUF3854)
MTPSLSDAHRKMLEVESGIKPNVIATRSYKTVNTKADLVTLGFSKSQLNVPTLLIPIFGVNGGIVSYQSRPDSPRIGGKGKPIKYETPKGSSMVLDVHPFPFARVKLKDPSIPLFITEGIKKGDALISRDLCAIALIGVWNWRGTNEHGGKTALADWEDIAFNERKVYIVFDSDVMEKQAVHSALVRLKAFLESRKANVFLIYLPHGESGKKQGVDDFLASGKSIDNLLTFATPELKHFDVPNEGEKQIGYYVEKDNQLFHRKTNDGNHQDTRLCNFTARIVAEVARDDGAEITRHLAIEGKLATGKPLPRASVPATQFASMNWTLGHWGVAATVSAGQSATDRIREAIQIFSNADGVNFETVYAHLGWREIDGEWVYLHAGGAIGKDGVVPNIGVDVGPALNLYQLPEPSKVLGALSAIKASFAMLEVAPDHLTIPLFLVVYRAAIDTSDFALYLAGLTGVRKSELAALAQQHFGSGLDSRHLPGNWSSTANSLEGLAFGAKDALLVVDDFAPHGNQAEQARYHSSADRLFRGQGNSQGRGRLKADGSSRPPKPPRGLILATGEELPRAHSIRARSLILEVKPNDVNLDILTVCQQHASSGLYAQALASFIQWLAARLEQIRNRLKQARQDYRQHFISSHGRTTDACAELMVTCDVWGEFAREAGFLSEPEVQAFRARVFTTLQGIAGSQAEHQRDADPVERFGLLLQAVFSSGRGHLASVGGGCPDSPEKWGYRVADKSSVYGAEIIHQPQGVKIGWVPDKPDIEGIYLEPEAAYAAVQQLAQQQNETLSMSKTTMYKRLAERGYIIKGEDDRNTRKVTIAGSRHNVINLPALYLTKTGTFGTDGTSNKNTNVDDGFTVPIPKSSQGLSGTIGTPSASVPKIETGHSQNRDAKNAVQDGKTIPCPESPVFTDIRPSEFSGAAAAETGESTITTGVYGVTGVVNTSSPKLKSDDSEVFEI